MASAGKEDQSDEKDAVVYHSGPDPDDRTELSTQILMALDSIPGYDIENSDTVVFEQIDLDALDELFAPVSGTERNGRVVFSVDRFEITVTAAGEITISEASTPEE